MASSTTIPKTKIKAKSEIMLMLESVIGIEIMAPAKLMGMPIIIQKDKSTLKKSDNVRKTKPSPNHKFFINKLMRSSKMRDESLTICVCTLDGN